MKPSTYLSCNSTNVWCLVFKKKQLPQPISHAAVLCAFGRRIFAVLGRRLRTPCLVGCPAGHAGRAAQHPSGAQAADIIRWSAARQRDNKRGTGDRTR